MTTRKYIHSLPEHELQKKCVDWFRYTHPAYAPLLFAVPNGAKRTKTEAAIKKAEGMNAGVSDLIFLFNNGRYGALCIEMKAGSSQSKEQKRFQAYATAGGQLYVVVKKFEEFQQIIENYLSADFVTMTESEQSRCVNNKFELMTVFSLDKEESKRQAMKEYEKMKQRMDQPAPANLI